VRTTASRLIRTALALGAALTLAACPSGSTEVTTEDPTGVTREPTGATDLTGPAQTGATGDTGPTASTGSTDAAVQGSWNGTWTTDAAPVSGTFLLEITPTPGGFEGSIDIEGSPCVSGGAVEIGVEGSRISFGVVEAEERISFTGTVERNQMSGTFDAASCPPPNTGTWEATLTG
jgi:hypothetical protein